VPCELRSAEGSPRSSFNISSRPRWSAIRMVAAMGEFNVRCKSRRNSGVISERDLYKRAFPSVATRIVDVRIV
jgi:hypothetical protein